MAELDEIFREFASAFAGGVEDANPICFPKRLCREELDLSLGSLKRVDEYLALLHDRHLDLLGEEWHSTVLYGGAYVGEVIRKETGGRFRWMDYDDYIAEHPEAKRLMPERHVSTCAMLVDDAGGMILPLNKVARFIGDGGQNSVHYFAECAIRPTREG